MEFSAILEKIGINAFVFIPENILNELFFKAGKEKGNIPVKGTINGEPFTQTLLKFKNEWRLYVNNKMLKNSHKRIGEKIKVRIEINTSVSPIKIHPKLQKALSENPEAEKKFDTLAPSLKKEIIRYISFLKTEESINKNVNKAIMFLHGEGSFIGRKKLE